MAPSVQSSVDWESIKGNLTDALLDALSGVIDGVQADLAAFGTQISTDIATALQMEAGDRRDALLQELWGQVQIVGEIQRIRTVNATWDAVAKIIKSVTAGAIAVLGAGINQIKPV